MKRKTDSANIAYKKQRSLLFSNKVKLKEKITPLENHEIISDDDEIPKIFKSYVNIAGNLGIKRNLECITYRH